LGNVDRSDFDDFIIIRSVKIGLAGIGVNEDFISVLGVDEERLVFEFIYVGDGSDCGGFVCG